MRPSSRGGRYFLAWTALALVLLSGEAFAAEGVSSPLDFDILESAANAGADSWRFSFGGYLESRDQMGISSGKFLSARQMLFAEMKAGKGPFSLYLSGEAELDPAIRSWEGPDTNVWRPAPKECYAAFESSSVDVFLGQRIVTWGTGDGINPLDLVNPDDTRDPAADVRTRSKRPVPMAHMVWKPSPFVVEAVVLPWAQVNHSLPENSPWTPGALERLRDRESSGAFELEEDDSPSGVEGGARVSATVGRWDVALIYFNGLQDHPLFSPDFAGSGRPLLREEHPRMQAYGVTFARGLYGGTVRGELAWKPDFAFAAADAGLVKADMFEGVLGLDQTFGKSFYVNIQYFVGAQMEKKDRVAGPDRMQGFTLSVSDLFLDDALEAGLKGVAYTESGQGATVQPYVSYTFEDCWKATLAYSAWTGPSTGMLGQYDDNDMVTLTLRYSF